MPKPRRTVTLPGLLHATRIGGAGGDQRGTATAVRVSEQHRHIKFWSSVAADVAHGYERECLGMRLPTRIINKPVEANGLADMGWL
jgi:hypothetical protein